MANQRRAGKISLQIDGEIFDAKGSFEYSLGGEKRTSIVGSDKVHGYSAMPKVAYIKGEITDRQELDVKAMTELSDVTVTLNLANGKTIVLYNAWYVGEGVGNSEEGNIEFNFEGNNAEEIV